MSEKAVAQRYARAIFDLGVETGQLDAMVSQIAAMADAYASTSTLAVVLNDPLVSQQQREAILHDLADRLGVDGLALNAIKLLVRRRRLSVIVEIARQLSVLSDDKHGVVRATVTSAGLLSAQYLVSLERELAQLTNRRVAIEHKQDPALLAGLVTRIGDNTIDGSIEGRLAELERQLLHA
jgi:F-type H+-transporting ATPase subunit delta